MSTPPVVTIAVADQSPRFLVSELRDGGRLLVDSQTDDASEVARIVWKALDPDAMIGLQTISELIKEVATEMNLLMRDRIGDHLQRSGFEPLLERFAARLQAEWARK